MTSILTEAEIKNLNDVYQLLSPIDRLRKLFKDFNHDDILVTSSFGTTSGILMGMVSLVAPGHPIHFIDTTFCFRKTIKYKNTLSEHLALNIIDVLPDIEDNLNARENKLWKEDPDRCCYVNKIKPFELYKTDKKLWISGLLMNQTPFRANLNIFEQRSGIIKMHPNIDTSAEDFDRFLSENGIPPHPMVADGYSSVSCTHCTMKGNNRNGRWANTDKIECGLHL